MMIDIFVKNIGEWHAERFGSASIVRKAAKLAEEAGEVCGAVIKRDEVKHDEREGKVSKWNKKVRSELGDVLCVVAAIAYEEGIDLELLMEDVWVANRERQWK